MNKQELRTNKQELISKYELIKNSYNFDTVATDGIISDLKRLDEPEKVKVKQFVADFIAEQKKLGHTLSYSIDASMSDRVAEWYWDNSELFALAWIFGYEVEEEKRCRVKIKGTSQYLRKDENSIFFSSFFISDFTRNDIEDLGFGWVFDCPGIEIEEVE